LNPRLAALASAVLFSTGGAAIKSTLLTSWQVAGLRSLIAAVTIALLIPRSMRGWTRGTALAAFAYAVCLTSFVLATKNTTSANAIFLQGTAPLYLVLLGPWLLKEKIKSSDMVTLVLVAAGMVLVFWEQGQKQALAPNPALGNMLGALSGLAWAATVCGLRWLGRQPGHNPMAPVLMGNCFALVFCLPQMLPVHNVSSGDIVALLYLGIVQVGLAYWCLTRAMTSLAALDAALLVMVEPALNPVWTWWLHGERPGWTAVAGGGLIIGSALIKSWHERKNVLN
jgi:drug/metabolite transporter (DMT)-like permease